MLYVLMCEDKPESEAIRHATRERHLAWVKTQGDRVRLAGPMLTDDGEHMVGSLFLIEALSLVEVHDFNAADPYTRAGLFQRVTAHRFRQVIPPPD